MGSPPCQCSPGVSPSELGLFGGTTLVLVFAPGDEPKLPAAAHRRSLLSAGAAPTRGLAEVRVGGVLCAHDPTHSTPSGCSLSCTAPAMPEGSYAVTVYEHGGANAVGATCTHCRIAYTRNLVANASLALTPFLVSGTESGSGVVEAVTHNGVLDAVGGDSVHLSISGANHLFDPSQLSILFTTPTSLHSSSSSPSPAPTPTAAPVKPNDYHTVLRRSAAAGLWDLRVRVPQTLSAGEHVMQLRVDRSDPAETAAHGYLRLTDRPSAPDGRDASNSEHQLRFRVHPSIERLSVSSGGAHGGVPLTISGSAFSPVPAENDVLVQTPGGVARCDVVQAESHRVVCVIGEVQSPAKEQGNTPSKTELKSNSLPAHPSSARLAHPALLRLHPLDAPRALSCLSTLQLPLRTTPQSPPSTNKLSIDALLACSQAAAHETISGSPLIPEPALPSTVPLRHELEWPALHPLGLDDDAFRHDAFLASSVATLRVPLDGLYSFKLHCDRLHATSLCEASLSEIPAPRAASSFRQPTVDLTASDPAVLPLRAGAAYELRLKFVHLEHGDHVRLSVNITTPSVEIPNPTTTTNNKEGPPRSLMQRVELFAVPASWLSDPEIDTDSEMDPDLEINGLAGEGTEEDSVAGERYGKISYSKETGAARGADGVSVVVNGFASVCQSPTGCGLDLSSRHSPAADHCTVTRALSPSSPPLPPLLGPGSLLTCTGVSLGLASAAGIDSHDPPRLFAGDTQLCEASYDAASKSVSCLLGASNPVACLLGSSKSVACALGAPHALAGLATATAQAAPASTSTGGGAHTPTTTTLHSAPSAYIHNAPSAVHSAPSVSIHSNPSPTIHSTPSAVHSAPSASIHSTIHSAPSALPVPLRLWTRTGGWAKVTRTTSVLLPSPLPPAQLDPSAPNDNGDNNNNNNNNLASQPDAPTSAAASRRLLAGETALLAGDSLLAGAERWSSVRSRGGPCASAVGSCVIPAGESWLLDADMDVGSLTVEGTLRWDTSVDGLVLSAGDDMLTPTPPQDPPLPNTAAGTAHSAHSTQPALRPHRATPR